MGIDAARGYLTHEAAEWHPFHERWNFFLRKVFYEPFDEAVDERDRGGNTLLIADEAFRDIEVREIGERVSERGVSSLKAIPGHPEELVALKSVECGDVTETYAFCFDLEGRMLSGEVYLGAYKCEGVEIV